MVTFDDTEPGTERTRHVISRVALALATVLLITGLTLGELGLSRESVAVLESACAILVATPILNVVSALIAEIRRREWPFVAAALLVLALLAYAVLQKLG